MTVYKRYDIFTNFSTILHVSRLEPNDLSSIKIPSCMYGIFNQHLPYI